MNAWIGWALVFGGLIAGWVAYGWPGLVLAISATVFWLLLQFSRVMRSLQKAGSQAIGQTESAVMLHSRLRKGLKLMDALALTGSLGRRVSEQPEVWRWSDTGGVSVDLMFERGRCVSWTLNRPEAADTAQESASSAS